MRKVDFVNGEHYHVFNRGVDKRVIFLDAVDRKRFIQGIQEFNTLLPIGSLFLNSFSKNKLRNDVSKLKDEKLVNIICYALNPNHYHFIIEQLVDRGLTKFMHRLGIGYAKYFNEKYERGGSLFQGPFKASLIDSNEYLLHLSAYVNLNARVHGINVRDRECGVLWSSWGEYMDKVESKLCEKKIILDQFKDKVEYKSFAEESLQYSLSRKDAMKELLID